MQLRSGILITWIKLHSLCDANGTLSLLYYFSLKNLIAKQFRDYFILLNGTKICTYAFYLRK